MKFNQEQHKIWETLIGRQTPNVLNHASKIYLQGRQKLNLSMTHVPTLLELNQKITPETDWKVIRTKIRYSDTSSWYQHFLRHEFIVTNYLRSKDELEFTPEPDMFHDIFGHLPFFTLPEYTEIMDMFTQAYIRSNPEQQEAIKRLGWFSYEFGLIRENGAPKAFGTGLISSIGELQNSVSGKVPILPFTIENVLKRNKAIASFNKELFIFESLDALKAELQKFFSTIKGDVQQEYLKVVDREMDLSKYLS